MPITIGAGFHFLGSAGEMIAPEIYFADAFNPNGEYIRRKGANLPHRGKIPQRRNPGGGGAGA